MSDLADSTALTLAAAIRDKEVSPSEVLDACLARIDARNGKLNAVVWRDDDAARQAARSATEAVARTDPDYLPDFHGVPIPVKDLTPVQGWPLTYGSRGVQGGVSSESQLAVRALARAGFVLAGRTNTPEFGLLTVTENLRYGETLNPWDLQHTPGGSSGGAAAAVAGGLYPIAHATDGGGSIRIPASCCGLVGLKVSRGRVPKLVTAWEGGAVDGVVSRDVADTAAVLDAISGPDRLCWYNAPAPERPFSSEPGRDPGRLRVGLVTAAPFGLKVDDGCMGAVELAGHRLDELGHMVEPAALDLPADVAWAFGKVVNSALAGYPGVDWSMTERHVRAAREAAETVDSVDYVRSVQDLQLYTRVVAARFDTEFDILVTPTMSIKPPRAGEVLAAAHAGSGMPAEVLQMSAFTSIFNVTGLPAISLPLYQSASGLPVGVQLVAGPWEEARLLQVAAQLEAAEPWSQRRPPADLLEAHAGGLELP